MPEKTVGRSPGLLTADLIRKPLADHTYAGDVPRAFGAACTGSQVCTRTACPGTAAMYVLFRLRVIVLRIASPFRRGACSPTLGVRDSIRCETRGRYRTVSTLSSDLRTLSREAFIYLYPLVTMEVTRRQAVSLQAGVRIAFGPANEFQHVRAYPPADFRSVVRPNFDTLYSSAWIDLTGGPVQVHVPDSHERYYMLPMLDMWTDVFANPGKRTTGTGPLEIVLTPPGYTGEVPDGTLVIEAPTPYVWIIGRTQTNGPADYPAVRAFQDGLAVTEIGSREATVPEAVDVDTEPLRIVNGMSGVEFLEYAARALRVNPVHPTDHSQVARLALLGVPRRTVRRVEVHRGGTRRGPGRRRGGTSRPRRGAQTARDPRQRLGQLHHRHGRVRERIPGAGHGQPRRSGRQPRGGCDLPAADHRRGRRAGHR